MIFGSYRYPREMTERLAEELKFKLYYVEPIDYDHELDVRSIYLEKIRWAEQNGIDVVISGYYNSKTLAGIKSSIPILTSNFSNWETLSIVHSLKKNLIDKYIPHPRKVGLLTVEPLFVDLQQLNDIFDLDLHNVVRQDSLDLPQEFFDGLKADGFEVVACARAFEEKVYRAGMLPFYNDDVVSYGGLRDELSRTLQMVRISRQITQRNRELSQIIDYSFEAVWMTDPSGRITTCNAKAGELFDTSTRKAVSTPETDYIGRSVYESLPDTVHEVIRDALQNGTAYYSYLMLHTRMDGVFNITPIVRDSIVESAVFHFTSLPHLEQVEEKIKMESYVKGHYARYHFSDIVGSSGIMKSTIELAKRFARYEANILIMGESGTGKEMFAQGIHNESRRRSQPFVALNCGALPPSLLESELFGYVDGAFTGASRKGKKGLFEIAEQGTIFLDEISEMDAQGQIRLLRVLEEREVMRIGSDQVIPVNVRVIAASNKNLEKLVREGRFRQDLYYRLNVLSFGIPPLRKRLEDVALLSDQFLGHYGKKYQKIVQLKTDARAVLEKYDWPGNVRQLRNFCERLVIVADDQKLSGAFVREQLLSSVNYGFEDTADLYSSLQIIGEQNIEDQNIEDQNIRKQNIGNQDTREHNTRKQNTGRQSAGADFGGQREKVSAAEDIPRPGREEKEKHSIMEALEISEGSRQKAAKLLDISTATLWRKMKKHGLL